MELYDCQGALYTDLESLRDEIVWILESSLQVLYPPPPSPYYHGTLATLMQAL